MSEEIVFPPTKLWGLFTFGKKPLIIHAGEGLVFKGIKIYFKDVSEIRKNGEWKDDVHWYPIVIVCKTGKEHLVNLGGYQLDPHGLYESLLVDFEAHRTPDM